MDLTAPHVFRPLVLPACVVLYGSDRQAMGFVVSVTGEAQGLDGRLSLGRSVSVHMEKAKNSNASIINVGCYIRVIDSGGPRAAGLACGLSKVSGRRQFVH